VGRGQALRGADLSLPGYDRVVGERTGFPRELLAARPEDVAPRLLGSLLVRREPAGCETIARIVETEAYHQDDPASHSFRGRTERTRVMFGDPGMLYVYFTYGMHWCANVSTQPAGTGSAVLLRAGVVLAGRELVRARRGPKHPARDLLRGPARLTQGLDISGHHDGLDLLDPASEVRLERDAWAPPANATVAGPRTGVRQAADLAWRFHLAGVPEVSRHVRHPRAVSDAGRRG